MNNINWNLENMRPQILSQTQIRLSPRNYNSPSFPEVTDEGTYDFDGLQNCLPSSNPEDDGDCDLTSQITPNFQIMSQMQQQNDKKMMMMDSIVFQSQKQHSK